MELSLAEEVKNALLQENEHLKQELRSLKNSKVTYVLELEDKVKQQDEEIKSLTKYFNGKETETHANLKSLENTLSIKRKQTAKLIFQAKRDKKHYDLVLETLGNLKCTSCKIYNDKVYKILDSIKSLETATAILQNENESLMDQIKKKDFLKSVFSACFPPLSKNTQHLVKKLCQ